MSTFRIVFDKRVQENGFRCTNCNIHLFIDGKPDPEILVSKERTDAGCPFCHNHIGRIFEISEDFINNNYERRFSENGKNH